MRKHSPCLHCTDSVQIGVWNIRPHVHCAGVQVGELCVMNVLVYIAQGLFWLQTDCPCVPCRDAEGLYVGFKELSYCTLRAQLLMALHDDNSAVATRDACHELAWTLDAGIMNGQLGS